MIRFCDKEVFCIYCDEFNRSELLSYFLNGHLDDPVCVLDANGGYLGYITYHKLLKNSDIDDAIEREQIVLDKDIWKKARLHFALQNKKFSEYLLVPVINDKRQLICFAYEDSDADRELRMLRELQERADALQFADIYPEYECVKIHEFNELAYFFAKYLRTLRIPVQVEGSMWETFLTSDEVLTLDYRTMMIYAEGVLEKPVDWMENLLRSASVEFECIDRIYEENIKAGIIKDADGNDETLINYLKENNEIVILGTDVAAQDTYDYFRKMGIEVCCFAEGWDDKIRCKLFGKPVLGIIKAMKVYAHAVFIDSHEKGSAWGMGKTDYFDYLGYARNRDFFLLKDYMKIQGDSLKSTLRDQNIILIGDVYLCDRLAKYFEKNEIFKQNRLEYVVLPDEKIDEENIRLKIVNVEEVRADVTCLIVVPGYFWPGLDEKIQERKKKIIAHLMSHGIVDYTDYFSHTEVFLNIEKETKRKYQLKSLQPKRVVLGSINACCGNVFIRGLLDGHPSIMMIDCNYLNTNLFWFCIRLADRDASEIPLLFRKLYQTEWEGGKLKNIDVFIEKMYELLKQKNVCTSQELFVIFHIAYMSMWEMDITDINEMVIYWEPHYTSRNILEDCVQWLGTEEVSCDILNVVRNICMRNGSNVKGILDQNWPGRGEICQIAIATDDSEKKNYSNSKRLVVRFEDLKCKPEEELHRICREWDIPWSESLMHSSLHGNEWVYNNGNKKIKDFDLTPVYHTYEEYFSEFDRFKIALICRPWQEKYGYPYVDMFLFSRREVQEMFLKEFRFMERLHFDTKRTKMISAINFQIYVKKRIQKMKMLHWVEH